MFTKLDVVNSCLGSVGENPVTNAESNHPSVIAVRAVFDRVTKSLQSRGWWYNNEEALTLSQDIDGYIIVPSNTLKADPTDPTEKYIQRGTKMYDPENHTFIIGRDLIIDLMVQLDIEDCPHSMADWILKQCTYEFYRNDDGDRDKAQSLMADAHIAEIQVKKEHLAASDINSNSRPISQLLMSRIKKPLS